MASLLTRPVDAATTTVPAAPEPQTGRRSSLLPRARAAAVCLAFAGLTLSQQPGRILPDTKLDLAVDPWGFLGRSLQLWEPEGFAGQLQNQTYGYLFPMGPFYALLQGAGMPVWVVQRLWMALLLSLAFLGVVTLARHLRIGTPGARMVAGLAYALAPRMISGLGATSVEVLPMALAPWVLVPLVIGARGGSPRRAAALSGLAVLCVGGVNAVATAAVLPLAALYLLTRPAGPRRRRLMAWWAAAVTLATAWWVGPLLLLGRYSPPFLDYIESAATTTAPTGLFSALRGTTQWLAYLAGGQGPVWPAGWELVHDALPVLATVVLAAAGVAGLARLPDRTWLVLGVLGGLVLVTAGHLGVLEGLAAQPLHSALDGLLAPLRNVHKFDPVLRLPLALGVGALAGGLFRAMARRRTRRGRRTAIAARAAVAVLVLALVTTASPAIGGRLAPPTGFESVPGYWADTAAWLADAQPSGRALLLPASSFGTYVWGTTADEPLQPLADSAWEVRSAVPLTQPAHIRMLDEIEERLARGEGSAGLTRYLARAGISHLVVRNDLDAGAAGATRPALVHQALRTSPGITRVATFGPRMPAATSLLGRVLDGYLTAPHAAVEVFAVDEPAPRAWTVPLADAVDVAGGPDGVLALEDRGLLSGRPALLAGGDSPGGGNTMVSDAQQRRERSFGRIGSGESAALTADDPLRLDGGARDYLYPGTEANESVVRHDGGTVSAAGSASDADSVSGARPENHPWAAVDGDLTTAWRPPDRFGQPQPVWWRIDADRLIPAREIVVRLAADPAVPPPAELVLRTDSGVRTVPLAATTAAQRLRLPAGPTSSLTISVDDGRPTTAMLALAEVSVPGVAVSRTVVTPVPDGPVDAFAFETAEPASGGCAVEATGRPRCSAALVHGPEETGGLDRAFPLDRPASYDVTATVTPRPGPALDALISATARPWGPVVTATSAVVPDPRAGADAAVDGDPETAWIAATADGSPSLTLAWAVPQTIGRIALTLTEGTAASRPTAVAVGDGGLARTVPLDEGGVAEFAPLTTDRLTVSFPLQEELTSYDPYTRAVTTLGIGVSELTVDAVPVADPGTVVELGCGEGPTVELDGETRQTSLRTTLGGLRALRPVELTLCGDTSTGELATGEHSLRVRGTAEFAVTAATLLDPDADADPVRRRPVAATRWDAEHRTLELPARTVPTLLVLPENANPGWEATLDGEPLETRTVDGWQQGYVLPVGPAGTVSLDFAPGAVYRAALAAGAGAVLLLACLLLVPSRRPGPPPTGRRRAAGAGGWLLVAGAAALVAGLVGLGALVASAVLAQVLGSRGRAVLGWLAAVAMLAAGAVFVALPGAEPWIQGPALAALTAGTASALAGGTRWRHRRRGRSTSRWTAVAAAADTTHVPRSTSTTLPVKGTQPNAAYAPASTSTCTRNRP